MFTYKLIWIYAPIEYLQLLFRDSTACDDKFVARLKSTATHSSFLSIFNLFVYWGR